MSERVIRALKRVAEKGAKVPMMTGTVKAVNGYLCDVDPSDGGAVYYDVRLKVAVNDNEGGAYAIPVVGSKVLIAMLDGHATNLVVVQAEAVDEYVIKVEGNAELRVKPNGIVTLNGDTYGGMVIVQELRSELNKVNAFLNALRTAITSAPVTPSDGGATFKASLISSLSSLVLPTYSGIESNKTKHGGL